MIKGQREGCEGKETEGKRAKRYRKEKNGSTYTPVSSIPRV